jgi:hypothetical protein
MNIITYIPLTLYPEEVAEASQILLQDTHVLPKLLSLKEYCRRDEVDTPSDRSLSQV